MDINIKSSTIEKALESITGFLAKLAGPATEEIGQLLYDKIRLWRFKNQLDILLKAKDIAERKNITLKEVPYKILVPLLENCSLEGDDEMKDNWASLIVNLADSEKNIQNNIFPHILSQISIGEFHELKHLYQEEFGFKLKSELVYNQSISNEYDIYLEQFPNSVVKSTKIEKIRQEGFDLNLHGYEISNLLRLTLIRQLPPRILVEENRFTGSYGDDYYDEISLEAIYDNDSGFRITDLGSKLIEMTG